MSDDGLVPRVVALAESLGCEAMRNNSGTAITRHGTRISFGKKGWSDILLRLPDGRFGAIETKAADFEKTHSNRTNKERLELQRAFIERTNRSGGCGLMSCDFEQIRVWLEGVCRQARPSELVARMVCRRP